MMDGGDLKVERRRRPSVAWAQRQVDVFGEAVLAGVVVVVIGVGWMRWTFGLQMPDRARTKEKRVRKDGEAF